MATAEADATADRARSLIDAPPPPHGWKARGDRRPRERRGPFNRPSVRQTLDVLPFIFRYMFYWCRHYSNRDGLFINTFQPLRHKYCYGVPCGALGSGSIGRDFRGGFCKFGLRPAMIEQNVEVVPADQFILTIRHNDSTVYQKVLCAATLRKRKANELHSWAFDFPAENLHYTGLYPRSWTEFRVPEWNLLLVCRQISPVIPHDYQESSLPVCLFVWQVANGGQLDLDVSVTMTFRNGTGDGRWRAEAPCRSRPLDDASAGVVGVALDHSIDGARCTFALAARRSAANAVSRYLHFNPSGDGRKLWQQLAHSGDFPSSGGDASPCCRELGVALCVRTKVAAQSTSVAEFCLVWHMPVIAFSKKQRQYRRRYTKWYGIGEEVDLRLACHALTSYPTWERQIDAWQAPVLTHSKLPSWYKSALFNELYFLTDGGSVWVEFEQKWRVDESQMSDYTASVLSDTGRFGYLESWEYRMINTYDVHFYASFALASLWPKLEHCIQADFADQVFHADSNLIKFHFDGDVAPVKSINRVPHDLGNPADEPWLRTNSYVMHDTGRWRDLNLKFVLMCYRDFVHVVERDEGFLRRVWGAVQTILADALRRWDTNGDGLIENSATADQTYDAWRMKGASAYCGGLWLAALAAARAMADALGDVDKSQHYADLLARAKRSYETLLWNEKGQYYNFDEGSACRDSIMADQLCGYWFLNTADRNAAVDVRAWATTRQSGRGLQLLPAAHVAAALRTIFERNVKGFSGGRMGAVNGVRPSGQVDVVCIQSEEVWTGVTYALASLMIAEGKPAEAFRTASGIYKSCFDSFGLQYQTPEALFERKFYRAIGYMRPLAIWAMQWVLERQLNFPNLPDSFQTESEEISTTPC